MRLQTSLVICRLIIYLHGKSLPLKVETENFFRGVTVDKLNIYLIHRLGILSLRSGEKWVLVSLFRLRKMSGKALTMLQSSFQGLSLRL